MKRYHSWLKQLKAHHSPFLSRLTITTSTNKNITYRFLLLVHLCQPFSLIIFKKAYFIVGYRVHLLELTFYPGMSFQSGYIPRHFIPWFKVNLSPSKAAIVNKLMLREVYQLTVLARWIDHVFLSYLDCRQWYFKCTVIFKAF